MIVYATWVLTFILLGWLGGAPMEYPYVWLSRFFVVYHFFFFLIYIPILDPIIVDVAYHNSDYESYMPTPEEEEAEHYEHITVNIYVIERMPKIAEKD